MEIRENPLGGSWNRISICAGCKWAAAEKKLAAALGQKTRSDFIPNNKQLWAVPRSKGFLFALNWKYEEEERGVVNV